jgi:hypothetical protein
MHQCTAPLCCCPCRLTKDSDRWGVLEGDGASVFYVLTPPWVRSRAVDYV